MDVPTRDLDILCVGVKTVDEEAVAGVERGGKLAVAATNVDDEASLYAGCFESAAIAPTAREHASITLLSCRYFMGVLH